MARYRLRHHFAGKLHSGWYRNLDCGDFLTVELPGIFPALERKDASVSGADQAAAGISSEDAELDGDDLEFRFCSKCNGNYEYCQYHLFTHEHVK